MLWGSIDGGRDPHFLYSDSKVCRYGWRRSRDSDVYLGRAPEQRAHINQSTSTACPCHEFARICNRLMRPIVDALGYTLMSSERRWVSPAI